MFNKLDNAGIHFSGKETPELANKTNAALANSAYSRNVPEEVNKVMREIEDRVKQGAMTYGDVRKIETQINNLKANKDPGTRSLAKELGNAVDDFMHTAKPTMPASSVGLVGPDDLANAKSFWKRGSQASTIEGLAETGTRKAADPTAKVEKNFEKYSDSFKKNPNKYNPNSPEQRRLIDEVVEGSPKKEMVANEANRGAKLLGASGLVGLGGSAFLPALGLSEEARDRTSGTSLGMLAGAAGLKGGSSVMRQHLAEQSAAKVNDLLRNIATGSTDASNAFVPRDALAKLMATSNAARGAGAYAGSYVNKKD